MVGLCMAPIQNRYYRKTLDSSKNGRAPPEALVIFFCQCSVLLESRVIDGRRSSVRRLYTPMLGGVLLPIGLFWLAW
jgi:hypothetical protein